MDNTFTGIFIQLLSLYIPRF